MADQEKCQCDGSGLRCNACIEEFETAAIDAATAELRADRDVLREALRVALNEAHVYRDTLNAVRERCNTLLEEARDARGKERAARAIIDAAGAIEDPESDAAPIVALLKLRDEWDGAGDKPIPQDEAIEAAHPMNTGAHRLYEEALRLVGAKRSKGALVDLVNWLLHELADSRKRTAAELAAMFEAPGAWLCKDHGGEEAARIAGMIRAHAASQGAA